MRNFLRRHRYPPPLTQVWVGHHLGEDLILRQGTFTFTHRDAPYDTGDARSALWTTIALRRVALLAYTVNGDGVPTPSRDASRWTRIWPFSTTPIFPPSRAMDDAEIRTEGSYHSKGAGLAPNAEFRPIIRSTMPQAESR